MGITTARMNEFHTAAKSDPVLQKPLEIGIHKQTLNKIYAPIKDAMDHHPGYREFDLTLFRLIDASYHMCSEPFTRHEVKSAEIRKNRTELLNGINAVKEAVEDAFRSHQDTEIMMVDHVGIYGMAANTHRIRDAAQIQGQFMGQKAVEEALYAHADEIDNAQKRLWMPNVTARSHVFADNPSSNDGTLAIDNIMINGTTEHNAA